MEFGDSLTSKTFKLNATRFSAARGCGGTITVIRTLALRQLDVQLVETPMREGRSEVGQMIKGMRFVSCKKEMSYKHPPVATSMNMIPSNSLTHAE